MGVPAGLQTLIGSQKQSNVLAIMKKTGCPGLELMWRGPHDIAEERGSAQYAHYENQQMTISWYFSLLYNNIAGGIAT